jgi:hypothetical protein
MQGFLIRDRCASLGERRKIMLTARRLCLAFALTCMGCDGSRSSGDAPQAAYDPQTGKLNLLKYDADRDGRVDTWTYMEGSRVVRVETDKDGDGKIDRWEYYGPDQHIQKIGLSQENNGKEDSWAYPGPDGKIVRLDVSVRRDGKVTRTEYYASDVLMRAEEDADGDGRVDKWETFEAGRLVSVAFDTAHRGTPDRRLVYAADGTSRMEVDPRGDGQFSPAK